MSDIAAAGHNCPPDEIETICAAYEGPREEAISWLDGQKVESEPQMLAVDSLRKSAREWRLALERGQRSAAAPLADAHKAELARWKPTLEDAKRIEAGLVALVDEFKQRLAEEKREAERRAYAEANAARRIAEDAARQADASNIEATRAAAQAAADADAAQRRAVEASKVQVKGLRKVVKYEITDHKALLNWIARNRKDDLTAFIEAWAQRNHKENRSADGLRVFEIREAF